MKRSELQLAISAAAAVARQDEILVIGSQSILGTYDETQLPGRATMSAEADLAPLRDDHFELVANLIDGALGEYSPFHAEHGFYVQGVSRDTGIYPDGWETRLIRLPGADGRSAGLCLESHDLCASKLARNEQNDRDFVVALVDAELIDPRLLRARVDALPDERLEPGRKLAARRFVITLERGHPFAG